MLFWAIVNGTGMAELPHPDEHEVVSGITVGGLEGKQYVPQVCVQMVAGDSL